MRILGPMIVSTAPKLSGIYFQGKKQINDARTDRFLSSVEKYKGMQKVLLAAGLGIQVELALEQDGTQQKVIFPAQKQIKNLGAIAGKASSMVKEDTVVGKFPDDNWVASFCDSAKDISREEMQEIWAQVLAKEIQNPESVSIRTLEILKILDPKTARLFEKLCSMCFVVSKKNHIFNAIVPRFSEQARDSTFIKYGLSFDDLNRLSEYNLIMLEYHPVLVWGSSSTDYFIPIVNGKQQSLPETTSFQFQGKNWKLHATQEYNGESRLKIPGVILQLAGQELLDTLDIKPNDEFADYVKKYLLSKGIKMVEEEE